MADRCARDSSLSCPPVYQGSEGVEFQTCSWRLLQAEHVAMELRFDREQVETYLEGQAFELRLVHDKGSPPQLSAGESGPAPSFWHR